MSLTLKGELSLYTGEMHLSEQVLLACSEMRREKQQQNMKDQAKSHLLFIQLCVA